MAGDQIEEIRRKTDIVELISQYVPLKKAGRNFKALCPFHSEKTPSFMVSSELQIFKCFGCQTGGDVYKFLMEYEKLDFPQALKILAEAAGVALQPLAGFAQFAQKEEIYAANFQAAQFYHFLLVGHPIGQAARNYLASRGVKKETSSFFKLGFAPDRSDALFRFLTDKRGLPRQLLEKSGLVIRRDTRYFDRFRARVIFPLADHRGDILGFAGRVIREEGDLAKYINTPDTPVYKKSQTLYGLDKTKTEIKKAGTAVVVEGEFDLISSWQAGVGNVVAIKGSALTEEQAELLSRFCQIVYLALDSDYAGDAAARRALATMQAAGLDIRVVDLGKFKDPDQAAQKDPGSWKKAVRGARGIYDFLLDSTFARFDPETAEGKASIGRTLAPILAGVDSEIVKDHFIKQTAARLRVSHEAVALEVGKQDKKVVVPQEFKLPTGKQDKPRRAVLEERLLSILFQTEPLQILDKDLVGFIKTAPAARLVEQLARYTAARQGFDMSSFASSLPGELVDFFASLVMADIQQSGSDAAGELAVLKKELQILDVRQQIEDITQQIKVLEASQDSDKLTELEVELGQVASRLTELEQVEVSPPAAKS